MITFILNKQNISTDKPSGMSLLDFIRKEMNLMATKSGCREGDCGACTVLEGTLINKKVNYKNIVSCLTPLGNVHGKHIVTLEGINSEQLSIVQQAMVDNAATQCGFCTPGFVMSFTSFVMQPQKPTLENAINSVSGNICRCTGYKSIERAANQILQTSNKKDINSPIEWMVKNNQLPKYFLEIPAQLADIQSSTNNSINTTKKIIAGGTDLMVQIPDTIKHNEIEFIQQNSTLTNISISNNKVTIGAATTIAEIANNKDLNTAIPKLKEHFKLISSIQIRNMGTVAGNIMNASPIGDLSIYMLALGAQLKLSNTTTSRIIALKDFFIKYKQTELQDNEYIESIEFELPTDSLINFEKVSKRIHLDIASVTSAIKITINNNKISQINISAGGVYETPKLLSKTCEYLLNKTISSTIIKEAAKIMQTEIAPISDIRGDEKYKRLLLQQLFYTHFTKLFPNTISYQQLIK